MQVIREFSKYQVVPINFGAANLAASQTDVQLKDGSGQVEGVSMPFSGQIVAFAVDITSAASAGTMTVGVTKGGTEIAATTQTFTTQTSKGVVFIRDSIPFAAGDKLGVEITTDASWNATTADLSALVYVALNVEGI